MAVDFAHPDLSVCVVGAGGVGGYFGAKLHTLPNVKVTFLLRPNSKTTQAFHKDGFTLHTNLETIKIQTPNFETQPKNVGTVDVVLVACKTYDLEKVAPTLKPLCRPQGDPHGATAVVPLQNGLDAPRILADALGAHNVMGGLCLIISYIERPGVVRYVSGSETAAITFGEMPQLAGTQVPTESDRARKLKEAFLSAGVAAHVPPDDVGVYGCLWQKFCRIVPFSASTALCRAGIGYIFEEPRSKALLLQVLSECVSVARAHGGGALLPETFVEDYLSSLSGLKKDATASLQRDMLMGNPSELHEQLGAMLRLAEEKDVQAPALTLSYAALLPQEIAARAKVSTASAKSCTTSLSFGDFRQVVESIGWLSPEYDRKSFMAVALGFVAGIVVARARYTTP